MPHLHNIISLILVVELLWTAAFTQPDWSGAVRCHREAVASGLMPALLSRVTAEIDLIRKEGKVNENLYETDSTMAVA